MSLRFKFFALNDTVHIECIYFHALSLLFGSCDLFAKLVAVQGFVVLAALNPR